MSGGGEKRVLSNKVVFVTGAGRGIGLGISEAIIEQNGSVVLADIDDGDLSDAENTLLSRFTSKENFILTTKCDVTDEKSVAAALNLAHNKFGRLDGLVNCAGVIRMGPDCEASAEDWRFQFEVNVVGTHICCNQFVRLVTEDAAIVNIASNAGKVGYANMAGYNASKAAVISLTRTLSAELAGQRINVNAVCPGGVDTPMLAAVAESIGGRINEDPKQLLKSMVPEQLGRHITPLEIGRVTAFLLSSKATIIRGQSINADGGDTPY